MAKVYWILSLLWLSSIAGYTQGEVQQRRGPFSRADSLRGALNPYRTCFDVLHYDLNVTIDTVQKSIKGFNRIRLHWVHAADSFQIDLQQPLVLDSVTYQGRRLPQLSLGNAHWLATPSRWKVGDTLEVTAHYQGVPKQAANPPWDGGFVWSRDAKNRHWVAVACEGLGASVWWPLKDHLSDKPNEGMRIAIEVPEPLQVISNGWQRSVLNKRGTRVYEWLVSYPIHSYNVTFYIGHYVHFGTSYASLSGPLKLDFYVLEENLEKARPYFLAETPKLLDCFEAKFGPYPFPADGFAVVEAPYWGMEHQGAIAYGNGFRKLQPWGFDYILVHESGHEWFGNWMSVDDHADMWVHEAFTTYAEMLYVDCQLGSKQAFNYLLSQQSNIENQVPMQGPRDVNFDDWPDSDMYYKGSRMLHTLRTALADDARWFGWLRSLGDTLGGEPIAGSAVVDYAVRYFQMPELRPFFDQYLHYAQLPHLEYMQVPVEGGVQLLARWRTAEADFAMPVDFVRGQQRIRLHPHTHQFVRSEVLETGEWLPDTEHFYITAHELQFETIRPKDGSKQPNKPAKKRKHAHKHRR